MHPKQADRKKITAIVYAVLGFVFLGYCLYLYFAPMPLHRSWEPSAREIFDTFVFCTFPLFSVYCLSVALKLVQKRRA